MSVPGGWMWRLVEAARHPAEATKRFPPGVECGFWRAPLCRCRGGGCGGWSRRRAIPRKRRSASLQGWNAGFGGHRFVGAAGVDVAAGRGDAPSRGSDEALPSRGGMRVLEGTALSVPRGWMWRQAEATRYPAEATKRFPPGVECGFWRAPLCRCRGGGCGGWSRRRAIPRKRRSASLQERKVRRMKEEG